MPITIPTLSEPDLVFGTTEGLPAMATIPEEFKRSATKWNDLFNLLFFGSKQKKLTGFIPKEGIDPEQAWRHVRALMTSWVPKHEHKEAGVAYLMSQYFTDYILEDK